MIAWLKACLHDIRRQGYVITQQEVYIGSLGIAAPVFGKDRKVIGSVSLSGPIQRIGDERKIAIRDELIRIAGEITDRMERLGRSWFLGLGRAYQTGVLT